MFRKKLIKGYDKQCKKALLYYKSDAFTKPKLAEDYAHTNYWESVEIANILNRLGYIVDIIDRTATKFDLKDEYELFIGIGAGDSGKYFPDIAKQIPSAIKIMYALGPEPKQSNTWVYLRYGYHAVRNGFDEINLKPRRMINELNIDEVMKYTDAIITCGNKYIQDTYSRFNKPIYRVYLSSHPELEIGKTGDSFLYFGGNGNIVKGLDLAIEAFTGTNLELYICAPDEPEYKPKLPPNIHWIGFIPVGGAKFNEVTSKCGYVILPSCSEACATSVTTCMRRGLIPIVTKEVGLDIGNFGYLIEPDVYKIRDKVKEIANSHPWEKKRRINDTYKESFNYTQENFTKTFTQAICKIKSQFQIQ